MTFWRRILLFHILALALVVSASAQAQSCVDPFTAPAANPLRLPQEGVLSPHELNRAKAILADVSQPAHERWESVANLYVDARVRMFPPDHRAALRRLLLQFKPKFGNVRDFEATTKDMVYAHAYRDTALPYVLAVHEWEHMIRGYARSGGRDVHAGSAAAKFLPIAMYKEEGAAIWAEWELARLMSSSEAAALTQVTQQLTKDKKTNSVVKTIAESRVLDRRDYLTAVRDNGRYSVGNVLKKTSTNTAIAVSVATYFGGVGTGACAFVYWIFH